MRVIAEGVETELQAERLRSIGCAYGQGHLFSPAVGVERATEILRAAKIPPLSPTRGAAGTASDAALLH